MKGFGNKKGPYPCRWGCFELPGLTHCPPCPPNAGPAAAHPSDSWPMPIAEILPPQIYAGSGRTSGASELVYVLTGGTRGGGDEVTYLGSLQVALD